MHTVRKRVVITNVSPRIDHGNYPAKALIHKELSIEADIFTDGHDEVSASVLLKHRTERKWKEFPMVFTNNDHWELRFYPDRTGFYQFRIRGWINHFAGWKKGLIAKYEAGQEIGMELEMGALLIREAAIHANIDDKEILSGWSAALMHAGSTDEALSLALGDQLAAAMNKCRDKELISVYPETLEFEAERTKAGFSTWYELFPRSASPDPGRPGTFNDVKNLLPGIAAMGFDTLYLPPIHPIGEEKRKGRNNLLTAAPEDPGSPWAIGSRLGGHKDLHPALGNLSEFRALVKAAEQHGLELAIDLAYQCAPDHPYVKDHPQWFNWRPDGTVRYAENPPKKYEDILPFNFESEDWKGLWEELRSIVEYWIGKGIRIFRVDNPHTKAFGFWEWMIGEVRSRYPEAIFLAEAFTRPRLMEQLAKSGFNQSYTYFTWRTTKAELEQYMNELTRSDLRYYFRPNFWPNTPDILPPEITYGGENALIRRLILASTLSSSYGLYGPVYEFGHTQPAPGKEEYIDNEKYEIRHWDWNSYTRIREIITRVNRIRNENPALQDTYNITFAPTTNEQIICYCKSDKRTGNKLIIAVNLDSWNTQGAEVKIPIESLGVAAGAYKVRDLLSGDKYRWQGEWNFVQLNPYDMPAHILLVEQ